MIKAISLVGQSSGRAGTLMNSSEELISRARRGDDEAFRLIFDRYARPIISFIYDMVGRRDLAEEIGKRVKQPDGQRDRNEHVDPGGISVHCLCARNVLLAFSTAEKPLADRAEHLITTP